MGQRWWLPPPSFSGSMYASLAHTCPFAQVVRLPAFLAYERELCPHNCSRACIFKLFPEPSEPVPGFRCSEVKGTVTCHRLPSRCQVTGSTPLMFSTRRVGGRVGQQARVAQWLKVCLWRWTRLI